MTTETSTAVTALQIVQRALDENIDIADVWIPVRRYDMDTIAFALARASKLEANLANMLTLLNGSVAPSAAPAAELTATAIAQNVGQPPNIDWLAWADEDLLTQYARFVEHLVDGNVTWRKLELQTKLHLTYWIIYRIQRQLGDETITVDLYDAMKPDWATQSLRTLQNQTLHRMGRRRHGGLRHRGGPLSCPRLTPCSPPNPSAT